MLVIHKAVLDLETLQWVSVDGYFSEGPVDLCCGPGHEEVSEANLEENLSQGLIQDFNTRYADQTAALGQINGILSNVQQGKLLPGFSGQTMAALQSQAIDTASANAKNVTQALNVANAGRGGDSGLQPGIVGQEAATALTGVANQEAAQQQNIQLANQQQAQQNTATALGGYNALAQGYNPADFGKLANTAEDQAFGQANQITNMYNQEEADTAAAAVAGGMDVATFGLGAAGGGGFQGGLRALLGGGFGGSPSGGGTPGGSQFTPSAEQSWWDNQ